MSRDFEELDYRETPLGELILRRRRLLSLGGMEIYEVKLGDAFLMSSLFHEVEMALAHLGLSELEGVSWDVVVGGLGLGYTAVAALEHREVASLLIVDALLNGVSILPSGNANKIVLPAGQTTEQRGIVFSSANLPVSFGDRFTLDVIQVGSGNAGSNGKVRLLMLAK
jgi:hypothetical protein